MIIFTPFTVGFAVVAIILAIGYALLVKIQAQTPLDISDVPAHHEIRLVQLDRQAIEQAYVQQVTFLFQQWMKDHTGQPERALRGARQARAAYSGAMTSIEVREKAK